MNLLTVLNVGLTGGVIMAGAVIALALAFRLFDFPDITVEGSFLLGASIFATLQSSGSSIVLAIFAGLVGGGIAGAMTALFHTRFRVNKFLAAIIVITISYSLSLRLMGQSNISLLNSVSLFDAFGFLGDFGSGHFSWNIIVPVVLFEVVLLVGLASFLKTRIGLRMRAAGASPQFARSLGISSGVYLVFALAVTNGIAAAAGILQASHQGFVDVGMGQGTLIVALASMSLGERILPRSNIPFYVFVLLTGLVGSIAYQTLVAFALQLGLSSTDLKLATGVLVLVVVALQRSKDDDLLKDVA